MRWGTMNTRRVGLLTVFGLAGLAAVPAHAATATVDPAWGRRVAQLISANYSYPRSAQLRGEQGKAKIKIAIAASGKVLGGELRQAAGIGVPDWEGVGYPDEGGAFPAAAD